MPVARATTPIKPGYYQKLHLTSTSSWADNSAIMNKSLGERIRELRKGRGLTQRKLAEAVGIDFTYLSKIENNTIPYSPSAKTLKKLATELQVDEWELLRLAEKLPAEMSAITNTELGIRFLRQASKMRSQEDWEELLAFMERRDKEEK